MGPIERGLAQARRERLRRLWGRTETPGSFRVPAPVRPAESAGETPVLPATDGATAPPWSRSSPTAAASRIRRVGSVRQVAKLVAEHFGLPLSELLAEGRSDRKAYPRQIAIWLARRLTTHSLTQIGHVMRRDHTTCLHAVRQVDAMRARDPELVALLATLQARAEAAFGSDR